MKRLPTLLRPLRKVMGLFQKLRPLLAHFEPTIERVLYTLSFAAVVLVVLNEFVPAHFLTLPWIDMPWQRFLLHVQEVTWSLYVLDFLLYGLASGQPWQYAKRHVVELVICLTWSPFTEAVLIHQLHNVLSLQNVFLIGIIAHVVRLARGAIRQFSHNPFIVLCCATGVLMIAGAATLTQVEPQTFRSFPDAAWYVYMTTFTIGTNINPQTPLGRVVTGIIVAMGMGLGSVFIGVMAETARQILFKGGDMQAKILAALTLNNRLVQECNDLLRQGLDSTKNGSIKEEVSGLNREVGDVKRMVQQLLEQQSFRSAVKAAPVSAPPPDEDHSPV